MEALDSPLTVLRKPWKPWAASRLPRARGSRRHSILKFRARRNGRRALVADRRSRLASKRTSCTNAINIWMLGPQFVADHGPFGNFYRRHHRTRQRLLAFMAHRRRSVARLVRTCRGLAAFSALATRQPTGASSVSSVCREHVHLICRERVLSVGSAFCQSGVCFVCLAVTSTCEQSHPQHRIAPLFEILRSDV